VCGFRLKGATYLYSLWPRSVGALIMTASRPNLLSAMLIFLHFTTSSTDPSRLPMATFSGFLDLASSIFHHKGNGQHQKRLTDAAIRATVLSGKVPKLPAWTCPSQASNSDSGRDAEAIGRLCVSSMLCNLHAVLGH
jgi:hypothetical protein